MIRTNEEGAVIKVCVACGMRVFSLQTFKGKARQDLCSACVRKEWGVVDEKDRYHYRYERR